MSKLHVGLLWFDDTGRELAIRVCEAAQRYSRKHGQRPNLCFVNPADLGTREVPFRVAGVEVQGLPTVLHSHLWIGVKSHEQNQEVR